MKKNEALDLISQEYDYACEKFPLFSSEHEGYAVILEELDELWDEIKNNKHPMSKLNQKKEVVQVGAMCVKYLTSLCEKNL